MNKQELLKVAKPILFNTDMVQAIQDNRKTVTRRKIKNWETPNRTVRPRLEGDYIKDYNFHDCWHEVDVYIKQFAKYQKGDILYVRETWTYGTVEYGEISETSGEFYVEQWIGDDNFIPKEAMIREGIGVEDVIWRPSIHMPKKHARIFLRVTDVRVERLQDITEEQAVKEGFIATFRDGLYMSAKEMFLKEMMDIYGVSDGCVFVYEFEKIKVKTGD